jgi:hypothetical protein
MNNIIDEITTWKLEAKLEDTARYFYHVSEVKFIEDGRKSYVIGRKGTGKTAVAEHLNKIKSHDVFAIKLSFKNFPFNNLYSLENKSYNDPNQYITLWKYVIYSSVAKLMVQNEKIDSEIRHQLSKIYTKDPIKSLSKSISNWISGGFKFTLLGSGIDIQGCKSSEQNGTPWIDRVEVLEEIISDYIGESKYYIVFDELDEDYKDIIMAERHKQYTALLTSLFKAVQDVKSIFPSSKYSLHPVIFLRDDIYDILTDPDKTKWNDLKIGLEWNNEKIKCLLAFRISRAIDPCGPILKFGDAWNSIFMNQMVRYGHKQQKAMTGFNYITRSTLGRPRDYIRYLQACAEMTNDKKHTRISPSTILDADEAFSNHLRSELEDEILGILPEIGKILDIFSQIRKQTLKVDEFVEAYNAEVAKANIPDRGADFVLKILFHFSVIGNQPKQINIQVFRYTSKEARFNSNESICIHRGFFKAMQIL